jgi:predicted TIM-barrel fold metal-dependent hydrolase
MPSRYFLFDANCFVGYWGAAQPGAYRSAESLLSGMDRVGIDEALVYAAASAQGEAAMGNAWLMDQLAQRPRLHSCWVVMPEHTGELPPPAELVALMRRQNVHAARLYPKRIGPLRRYTYSSLLAALATDGIVTFLDLELGHYASHLEQIDWDGLDWALAEFRDLPLVIVRAGQALDRTLLPFIDQHSNLYIETSYYIGGGGLERLNRRIGPERLLFGTGMPLYAPGPAITLLTYSGLSESDKRLVGGDNLRSLLRVSKSP